jgi:hypothetical protein
MKRLVLAALFVLVFAMVACGDDEEVAPTPPPTSAPGTQPSPTPGPSTELVTPSPGSTARTEFKASPVQQVGSGVVTDVRVGAHPESGGFDRIVFEFKAGSAGGWVEYVNKQDVLSCGPGEVVPLQGQAALKVHFDPAGQHEDFVPTNAPRQLSGPGNSILESKSICDFEAVLEWAMGTSGVKPFSVTVLDNPKRVVIDVKW